MKTIILTWNPQASDYTVDNLERDICDLNKDDIMDFYWKINPEVEVEYGDRFFLVRNDDDRAAGIVMAGYVCSEVYEGEGYGNQVAGEYYVDLDPMHIIQTEMASHINPEQLSAMGITLDKQSFALTEHQAELLEKEWLSFLIPHEYMWDGIQGGKSWQFNIEDFEAVPPVLQNYLKKQYGSTCCNCGKKEAEDESGQEYAFHVIPTAKEGERPSLESSIKCYCEECWFRS